MKMTMIRGKLIGVLLLSAAGAIALTISLSATKAPDFVRRANAAAGPRVIEIRASEYQFSPSEITLKKGEPVILRLSSADRTHGFLVRPLKIDAIITRGKPTDVEVNPKTSGHYKGICDQYCGTGHGRMKMKVIVVD